MSDKEAKRGKKPKDQADAKMLSWLDKKNQADMEEEVIRKEVDELVSWTNLIETMDEQQLREYVSNRPENLQSLKIEKSSAPRKKVQRSGKSKSSSASNWLMAAVWKFHKEEGDEDKYERRKI